MFLLTFNSYRVLHVGAGSHTARRGQEFILLQSDNLVVLRGVVVVLTGGGARGNSCEIAPEGLTPHRLGNPAVDTGGVVVAGWVPAGAGRVVQVQVEN